MTPHIAVIITDSARKIQWVNDDFTHITGFSFQEAVGKKPGQLLQGPLSEPEAVKRIRKGLEGFIPFQEEITNYRKNGEVYRCRLVIHPIYNEHNDLTNFIAFEADAEQVEDLYLPMLELKNKYQSSSLKGQEGAELYSSLKQLVQEGRLYLNPKLSLKDLSDALNTNTKYLSQVVNLHFGNNLQVFINQFRIEEAKRKLLEEELSNLTLYGIAMQCGFKNKSTFYKVFKQATGKTPLEYIRQHKKKEFIQQTRNR
ncbi:MAG: helix-turn-helix domain-containing protein [Saprospirales bacterium]|nr:helix-turn-helix domain-containing protein [Saprospirales bacterium]